MIAADQHELVQDYDVPVGVVDVDQSVPVTDRLLGRYGVGQIASLSFDKGFTRAEDRDLLSLYVPRVVMPKRGKKNAAETARESERKFVALRRQHSAVESDINSLEHHGLNRCLDVGMERLPALCGLRRVELQPARDRAGVTGASAGAIRDGAGSRLKSLLSDEPLKPDRSSVAEPGDFWRMERVQTLADPKNRLPPSSRPPHFFTPLQKQEFSGATKGPARGVPRY